MQFQLPSLHLLLTCSFVLLLAYLLSTIFSFLASSVIYGRSSSKLASRRPRTSAPHSRPPSIAILEPTQRSFDAAIMDKLQEEEDEDRAPFIDAVAPAFAAVPRAGGLDLADSLFDDAVMEIQRDEYSRQGDVDGIVEEDSMQEGLQKSKQAARAADVSRRWDDRGVEISVNGELDESDGKRKLDGDADQFKESENGLRWEKGEGRVNTKESTKLGLDASGTMSPPSRLPPTWSDLQKLVSMNSQKDLRGPAEPTLREEY